MTRNHFDCTRSRVSEGQMQRRQLYYTQATGRWSSQHLAALVYMYRTLY